MASWCHICRHKLNQYYVYLKGKKVHKKCRNKELSKKDKK